MSCINCGSPFHEIWDCTKPRKPSAHAGRTAEVETEGALKSQPESTGRQDTRTDRPGEAVLKPAQQILGKRRGRPQTITDMKAYRAERAKQYRAKKKAGK